MSRSLVEELEALKAKYAKRAFCEDEIIDDAIRIAQSHLPDAGDEAVFHNALWDEIGKLEICHGDDAKRLKAKLSIHDVRMLITAFIRGSVPLLRQPASVTAGDVERVAKAIRLSSAYQYKKRWKTSEETVYRISHAQALESAKAAIAALSSSGGKVES